MIAASDTAATAFFEYRVNGAIKSNDTPEIL
jgi:hypothetical protein